MGLLIFLAIAAAVFAGFYFTHDGFNAWVKKVWGWLVIIGGAIAAAAVAFWDNLSPLWS